MYPNYVIRYTFGAKKDIWDVFYHIAHVLKSPLTAQNYRKGIIDTIESLRLTGNSFAVSDSEFLRMRYGKNVRTIVYKKITIIYVVEGNVIIIVSVIPGGLIR